MSPHQKAVDLTIDLSNLCVCASCLTQEVLRLGLIFWVLCSSPQVVGSRSHSFTKVFLMSSQHFPLLLRPLQKKIILKMQSWRAWAESETLYNMKKRKKTQRKM